MSLTPIPIVRYSFIHFDQTAPYPKPEWTCRNNRSNDELGKVAIYSAWHQYCFFPVENIVLSSGCMEDIKKFIAQVERAVKA